MGCYRQEDIGRRLDQVEPQPFIDGAIRAVSDTIGTVGRRQSESMNLKAQPKNLRQGSRGIASGHSMLSTKRFGKIVTKLPLSCSSSQAFLRDKFSPVLGFFPGELPLARPARLAHGCAEAVGSAIIQALNPNRLDDHFLCPAAPPQVACSSVRCRRMARRVVFGRSSFFTRRRMRQF